MESLENVLETGTVLNEKWVILELIDRGGMGEVYRAHQLNLKRDIALKVISREWLQSIDCDPEEVDSAIQRFRREVEAMAQIQHPNVVQIFDYGSTRVSAGEKDNPIEYIAMEYIPGATLRSNMSEEGFYPDEKIVKDWLAEYFLPVLDGAQAMHDIGMVHRDLKPENVLMDGNTPKIADFGLARSCRLKPMTRSVDIKGTPPYMSPEQFFDFGRVDQRADIYSLGKILYEALCGKIAPETTPFKKVHLENPQTLFFQRMNQIIQDATAEERENRISSAQELKMNLEELVEGTYRNTHSSGQITVRNEKSWRKPIVIALIIASVSILLAAIFSIAFHTMTHHKTNKVIVPSHHSSPHVSAPDENVQLKPSGTESEQVALPQIIDGKNGTTFRLIPGGEVAFAQNLQAEPRKILTIKSFYMSETLVTNQQYVDFLNEVLPSIELKDGHVLNSGNVWLRLGEVIRGYKPITYREGKFHVKDAMHAACPVIRVTGYGAIAYARHYGTKLPTDLEWLYVLKKDAESKKTEEEMATTDINLPIPTPVILYKPNSYRIRALNQNIGEWGLRLQNEDSRQKDDEYVLLGGQHNNFETNTRNQSIVRRPPRKSYADVGFRTVMSTTTSG